MVALSVASRTGPSAGEGTTNLFKSWLDAYAEGFGSPQEPKFLRDYEKLGFHPKRQVPVSPNDGEAPISIADFAIPEKRLAIYIDGAAFHVGERLRRDRWIREKLRNGSPPWTVLELRVGDLKEGNNWRNLTA